MRNLGLQGTRQCFVKTQEQSSGSKGDSDTDCLVDICVVDNALDRTGLPSSSPSAKTVLLTKNGQLICVPGVNSESNETASVSSSNALWTVNLNQVCSEQDSSPASSSVWFNATISSANGDDAVVCLCTSGAIVSVSISTGDAEMAGEFENGIERGSCWSPDKETLLLITFVEDEDEEDNDEKEPAPQDVPKKSVILTMNSQFEVLAEVDMEQHVPPSSNSDDDVHQVSVCWKPDSSLCAISSVDASDSIRKVRFYHRETLELKAVGRTEDGSGKLVPNLQPLSFMSWAGQGCSQLLAAVQRKGKKTQQIAFFESNGLRHGEFPLRPLIASDTDAMKVHVLGVEWNSASDLLAVCLRHEECDAVQLWHRSNYHWYMKKELRYTVGQSGIRRLTRAKFDPDLPLALYVLFGSDDPTEQHCWKEYHFRWDSSSILTGESSSLAFVVDGSILNVTPLHTAIVPPPMYATQLELDAPVSQVVFSRTPSSPILALASLSNGHVAVVAEGNKASSLVAGFQDPVVIACIGWGQGGHDFDPTSLRDFVIVHQEMDRLRLLAIEPASSPECCEVLVEIQLVSNNGSWSDLKVVGRIALAGRVLSVCPWLDSSDGALLQLDNGDLFEYAPSQNDDAIGSIKSSESEPLLEPCPWIAALKNVNGLDDGHHEQRTRLVVGLSSKSRLYCHDLLITESASSFVLSIGQSYLCFATAGSRCQIRFLALTDLHNFDPLMGSDENAILQGYEPRNVERGAIIVAITPHKPLAVLQMPRGNLESVYPRALVLRHVVILIRRGDYLEAFEMMRRQKIDLNLIVDLDPRNFLKEGGNAEIFVEQILNIDHMNLFISSLQNWDSTRERFCIPASWRHEDSPQEEPFDFTDKVNKACRLLRSIMLQAETTGRMRSSRAIAEGHFLLPILSTFAKEDPPKLEDALILIKKNALSKHTSFSKKPPLFSDAAQNSIQYLAFLAEYEMLFDTALGLYDYDIARAVARNSQMDPKKYLPLLKRYRELPAHYARFEVDLRLKRYELALKNLVESGSRSEVVQGPSNKEPSESGNDFERCLKLINEHSLFKLGLSLFQDEDQRRRILLALGDYLLEKKEASSALSVFLASKPPVVERAQKAARACRDWKTFFALTTPEDESSESGSARNSLLAHQVADELANDAEFSSERRRLLSDAARILLDHGNDAPGAVNFFLQAEMWNEGRRIACSLGREDLVRKCVDGAATYAHSTISDLQERSLAFCAANTRYTEVLKIRREAIRSGEIDGTVPDVEIDDAGSLFSAASNASQITVGSTASTSSTGTVSSVISIQSKTSFSISGSDAVNRHKSKYNQVGDRKKKKKKKSKGRNKALPGSEKELLELVQTLRSNCIEDGYRDIISDTITFLVRSGNCTLARCLFDCYMTSVDEMMNAKTTRIDQERTERAEMEKQERREGARAYSAPVVLGVEKEVNEMACAILPADIHTLLAYLPEDL